jgi:cell division protein ZapA (FtsZ GTPase activity inhibitor)
VQTSALCRWWCRHKDFHPKIILYKYSVLRKTGGRIFSLHSRVTKMNKDFLSTDLPGLSATRQMLDQADQSRWLLGLDREAFSSVRDLLSINDRLFGETERLAKTVRELDGGWRHSIANSVRSAMDSHQRMLEAAAGPLLKMRADTLYEDQIKRATSALANPLDDMFKDVGAASSMFESLRCISATDTISQQIAASLQSNTLTHLAQLAKPFTSVSDHLYKELDRVKGLGSMFDPGDWARRLGVPMLDAASIATVARSWGADGAMRALQHIGGVDIETVRQIAAQIRAEESLDGGPRSKPAGIGRQGGGMSIELLLSIFAIVLSIAMYQWAKEDSEEMEARLRTDNSAMSAQIEDLSSRVQEAERRNADRLDKLTNAFERAMNQIGAEGATQFKFIVRVRGASIHAKKGGRATVGEVLPGQSVVLLSEKGKWIEISYFDYASGKDATGWAFKKYFARVQPTR